ncbi:microsomal glutathione S-transferase 2 [Callospermophilus lateralis]|uniref:microsomal glutathione S-transferase 2 n=1 Tax=Callospermophilus lateralis TaxID=76772 RepID=UPI004053DD20
MAGWYFSEVFAAILGLVYIYGRHKYFWGYSEATEKRMSGLELSLRTLSLLTVLSGLGIANCCLEEYLNLHITKNLRWPF